MCVFFVCSFGFCTYIYIYIYIYIPCFVCLCKKLSRYLARFVPVVDIFFHVAVDEIAAALAKGDVRLVVVRADASPVPQRLREWGLAAVLLERHFYTFIRVRRRAKYFASITCFFYLLLYLFPFFSSPYFLLSSFYALYFPPSVLFLFLYISSLLFVFLAPVPTSIFLLLFLSSSLLPFAFCNKQLEHQEGAVG